MYYIYEIKNLVNNKTYIGQRKCPENKTPETDIKYMGSGELIIKAIKKYGVELTFGWINSWDDDGIILKDSETDEEIYL